MKLFVIFFGGVGCEVRQVWCPNLVQVVREERILEEGFEVFFGDVDFVGVGFVESGWGEED